MSLQDQKITESERDQLNVKSVSGSRLKGTVQENKNIFDRLVEFLAERYNSMIDNLSGTDGGSGSEEVGSAGIDGLNDPVDPSKPATTVWRQIKALFLMVTGHMSRVDNPHDVTKAQVGLGNADNTADVNKPISAAQQAALDLKLNANLAVDFIKDVQFDSHTGVFTFYQHDGTSFTVDTVLEKVPISCRLDGTDFILTLEDETEQRVSLAAFVDVYGFGNTPTVKFTKAAGSNTYTAEIPDGAVGREKLAPAVMEELIGLEQSARMEAGKAETKATEATGSAQVASGKATEAATSAGTASAKAVEASASAQTAETKAAEAGQRVTLAESWAIGGTSSREGEDTDNAKYYSGLSAVDADRSKAEADRAKSEADRASEIVGGDFATRAEAQGYVDTHNAAVDAHADLFGGMAGKNVAGLTLKTSMNVETGEITENVAGIGAEIFNDYRDRNFVAGEPSTGNVATGIHSHAEGMATTATGSHSHTEGYGSKATGANAHAEGFKTVASSSNSHAEGSRTEAKMSGDHAEGSNTIASGGDSHAEGSESTASGTGAHAEGQQTIASGNSSHAEGAHTEASGFYSHAEGSGTVASGDYSHAEGSQTKAIGNYSHAEGISTTASGNHSHAEGSITEASGQWSHAEGLRTKATAYGAHAEGWDTVASGARSHAEGQSTQAKGSYSHAEGCDTISASASQHVQGEYNIEDDSGTYVHIVGNGGSTDARSNAHTLDWDGNAWFAGTVKMTSPTTLGEGGARNIYVMEGTLPEDAKDGDICIVL